MLQALINIFRIQELRNKVLFTLGMLAVFRVGHWIPLPGVDQAQLKQFFEARKIAKTLSTGKFPGMRF